MWLRHMEGATRSVQPLTMQYFLPRLGRAGDGGVLHCPDVTDVGEEGDTDRCTCVDVRGGEELRGVSEEARENEEPDGTAKWGSVSLSPYIGKKSDAHVESD